MACPDFTLTELTQRFGLDFQAAQLFPGYLPQEPSAWLVETLQRAQRIGYVSGKCNCR